MLVYQPKVNLIDQKIIGLEALARWNHPTFGLIEPEVFIPIAEETGLIIKIGKWVLKTACEQYAKWRAQNNSLNFTLAVNVSPQQIRHYHFLESLQKILVDTQMPSHLLELELTEMSTITNIDEAKTILNSLHDLGIKLSIDDFGTGYSTLSRLKHLPIDSIKIDKSFIKDVNKNPEDAMIVKAAIDLAKGLGLNVVAEGVETEAQLKFLRSNYCPQAQGFYYSEPVPSHKIMDILSGKL